MTWSYSGDPATSALDAVRFLIGDTDTTDQKLSDEEIAWLLNQRAGSVHAAAADGLRDLARRLAQQASFQIGRYREDMTAAATLMNTKADELEAQAAMGSAVYAGGISVSDKAIDEGDPDRVRPGIAIGIHKDPGTTGADQRRFSS